MYVEGKRWLFNRRTRYAHSLPEVDGPTITVTKKTSVVQLNDVPTIIDNNQRELFDRLPGIVIAEQQNPTALNLSYRGLGNPQESEYILLMQDGIPLEMDWIGYPTIYYHSGAADPQLGANDPCGFGSTLRARTATRHQLHLAAALHASTLAGTTEQVGGSNSLFSSFNEISGTSGNWNYLADYSRRQSDGQRQNGDYELNAGDLHLGYAFDSQKLSLDFHAYSLDSGLAGLMSGAQFLANPNQTTTPQDHLWADRYTAVLTYENKFSDQDSFTQKIWLGYQDLWTRSDTYAGEPPVGTGGTLSGQRFDYTGLDGRWLHRWGAGDALTVGYTFYTSHSPYNEWLTKNPVIDKDDESGIPFYDDQRKTTYGALFAENVFRFEYFHLVTSARFDHEELEYRRIARAASLPGERDLHQKHSVIRHRHWQ